MKKILALLVVGLIIVFSIWYFSDAQTNPETANIVSNGEQNDSSNRQDNENVSRSTYQNQQYGFSLTYPSTWQVVTSDNSTAPKITLYGIRRDDTLQPPFDHFANETHFSVYPQGIPTEGLFGEYVSVEESGLDFPVALSDDSRVYVLESGTPFAAYLKLASGAEGKNENWNDSGYVWLRAYVEDVRTTCYDANENILTKDTCDPLTEDHTIVWNGSVNSAEWNTLISIAQSFTVTGTDQESENGNQGTTPNNNLRVDSPAENETVSSPLTLEGEARGTWLFEATTSVVLESSEGEVLGEGIIEADGNWMTEDFVPFSGTLTFEVPEGVESGTLIFEKANPSGRPENDATVEYPVRFE